MRKKRKIIKYLLTTVMTFSLFLGLKKIIVFASNKPEYEKAELVQKTNLLIGMDERVEKIKKETVYKLPVPLINQMSEPSLKYGCEVTALTMLLNYYHFDYTKNELQDVIEKEVYQDDLGYFGDPDKGFVGDATGKQPGTGVNVAPIEKLARKHVDEFHKVINSTGESLSNLLSLVEEGTPIWVIVTIDYSIPSEKDFIDWPTQNGVKQVSFKHHAAVITGFDSSNIYLNDAFGKKISVTKKEFDQIYSKMGKQSLYIKKMIR